MYENLKKNPHEVNKLGACALSVKIICSPRTSIESIPLNIPESALFHPSCQVMSFLKLINFVILTNVCKHTSYLNMFLHLLL